VIRIVPRIKRNGNLIGILLLARRKETRMENVQLVRLVSGEEVLAKIENIGEATKFDKPHLIIPTQAKGIALMPWCPYSKIQDDGVTVPNDKIVFIAEPHDDLAKEYTTMVTGIEMPTAGDVAGVIGSQLLTED
jgi:hypothetical protein